jgi:competence protein ComEC
MHFESSGFVDMHWKRAPFLRVAIPLMAGICLQSYLYLSFTLIMILILVAAGGLLLCRRLPVQWRYAAIPVRGLLLLVLVTDCGCLLIYKADLRRERGFWEKQATDSSWLLLEVNAPPVLKERTCRAVATINAVCNKGRWIPVKGYLQLYLTREDSLPDLAYGQRIITRKRPVLIKNNGNPGAFDYQQYCAGQQIYQQLHLVHGDYYLLPQEGGNPIDRWLISARDYCLESLKAFIGKGPESGMAEALLIGYRQDLDKDVVQSYGNTGIVHIIAISGMHLALLYSTLLWMLKWLPAGRWANITKAILVLGALWGFALLTGASASVLRSAVMFTGITTGRLILERYSSIYNTLAASAVLLLWFNPYLITDAGFQLSYLAVLGILLFYQPLYRCWQPERKWVDLLWQMIALSLAAQLVTTPVSLFYFHQFPVYFLPANLVAVPLSTVAIYGEILLLLVASLGMFATWVGKGLQLLIMIMNGSVKWLGDLPGALIKDIHCSLLQAALLYLFLTGAALLFMIRWRPGLWLALISCWGYLVLQAGWETSCRQQRLMVIYNVTGYTAIDCINGREARFTGQDTIFRQAAGVQISATRQYLGVEPGAVMGFNQYGRYISFLGKQLVIIDSILPAGPMGSRFRVDYVFLNNNPHVNIPAIMTCYDSHCIVAGAANSRKRIQQWKEECHAAGINFYSIPEQGALIVRCRPAGTE